MTRGYITIRKTKQRQTNKQTNKQTKNIHRSGRWNLISSAGEPEQKWLYWNPQNSRSGHQLMSPTTWVTIFNWSPYLHLQNAKLCLSNFTVTSPLNRDINYTSIGILLWNKQITKEKAEKQNYFYYHYH